MPRADYDNPLDPTEDPFRIRMICVMLETCGNYLNKRHLKKKLDLFILFFQVRNRRSSNR
jgi:regulator of nonsense transcripts 2